MGISQNKQAVLLIDGSNGIRETTSLIYGTSRLSHSITKLQLWSLTLDIISFRR
jgi:hypothetical protein